MNNAYAVFTKTIRDTRQTTVLYDYFDQVMNPPCDYSDLLRWQWVQSISALDKLIHDLVKVGVCQAFKGSRHPTSKFHSMPIDIKNVLNMDQNSTARDSIFESYIISKFKTYSFQDPDKISDGLSYIWDEPHKWQKIADAIGKSENDIRTELRNIVLRRNQISHEGDYVFHLGDREPIERADTVEVVNFIETLGSAIYNLVNS